MNTALYPDTDPDPSAAATATGVAPLHLLCLRVQPADLLRFAAHSGVRSLDHGRDADLGYTLHLWLTALFGAHAPKPFRWIERKSELWGYASRPHTELLEHARTFAHPLAWAALDASTFASRPMPGQWRSGQRLRLEVLASPVQRRGKQDKDAFLCALDRWQAAGGQEGAPDTPQRAPVYLDWFRAQWAQAFEFERLDLLGLQAQVQTLRCARNAGKRMVRVERPQALFAAQGAVADPQRFARLLARGIGRSRAFGLGMVLLTPLA